MTQEPGAWPSYLCTREEVERVIKFHLDKGWWFEVSKQHRSDQFQVVCASMAGAFESIRNGRDPTKTRRKR